MKLHRGDLGHPEPSLMGPGGDIGWKRESGDDSWEAVCGGLPQPTRWVGGPVQVGRHRVCNGARRRREATFLPDPLSCCSAPSHSLSSPLKIPPDLTTSHPCSPLFLHEQTGFWMSPSLPHTPTPPPGMPDLWKRLMSQWTRPPHSQNQVDDP